MNTGRVAAVLAFLSVSACSDRFGGALRPSEWMVKADTMGVPAFDTAMTGRIARSDLREASGAALSVAQPGVLFTINDSGNEALLYATDVTGADRGAWRVTGATNDDWEAVSMGPCATKSDPGNVEVDANRCIYIGDTGDNWARRPSRAIYRVPEPMAQRAGFTGSTARAQRLEYSYPDGPRDVEAMYVTQDGTIFLITKRPLEDSSRHMRPALVYQIPAMAWRESKRVVAQLVDSLPIVPGSAPWRYITDAALAPDGRHVAVRTYTQVFVFGADSVTGRLATTTPHVVCNIAALAKLLDPGEGIAWSDALGTFILTSEGKNAAIYRVKCPLPASKP